MAIDIVHLDHEELPAGEQQTLAEADQIRLRGVTNWRELSDAFRERVPDVVLLNIHLGGVPAGRAIELLLGNPQTAAIPRILLSTLPKGSSLYVSAEAFAQGWIQKPLTRLKLIDALQRIGLHPGLTAAPAKVPDAVAVGDEFQQPVTTGEMVAAGAVQPGQKNVSDLRSVPRFVAEPPIPGSFGSVGIQVIDLGESGAQIEHAEPLKLSSAGRLLIASSFPLELRAHVVWSKLTSGQRIYRSGLRIDEKREVIQRGLKLLLHEGHAHLDSLSLDRKREAILERHRRRLGRPALKVVTRRPPPPADQVLLVRQAREYLRTNSVEGLKWYNRARYASLSPEEQTTLGDVPHREELLAVWEYLERGIPLAVVAAAFETR